ncbi:MAG TPA: hypothetical protein VMD07_09695 [Candidatus Acidoferrales bacterium]|nr:hypothetical protein [Candidatus Acidoferrales bacterium]
MSDTLARDIVAAPDAACRRAVTTTLRRFGAGALRFARAAGIRVHVLGEGECYRDLSPALRRLGIDVDAWPAPPAGLFVVEERRVYLRALGAMTVAHEFGHALDCALGGGTYRSAVDPAIRRAYSHAKAFVTPYAASGIDEYFAEAIRAHIGANDPVSPWPQATRARLRAVDPVMAKIVSELFRFELSLNVARDDNERELRRFHDHQEDDDNGDEAEEHADGLPA